MIPVNRPDPYSNPSSIRFKFRQRRFRNVAKLIDQIIQTKGSCDILDIGGTEVYWRIGSDFLSKNTGKITISLLNLEPVEVENAEVFTARVGDACDLGEFSDHSFDLVHSNSVIEHVGSWDRMKEMAGEVRRLAPHYFIQTPYFWFPFEPHYSSVGYQWFPQNIQAKRLMTRRRGFMYQQPDIDKAMDIVQHVVLLDKRQFFYLFPDGRMEHEKVFGFTKSLIAVR